MGWGLMSELRIDAAFLNKLATSVSTAGSTLSFAGWNYRSPANDLQSDSVADALSSATSQQLSRARLAETSVSEAGSFPAAAAEEFLDADAKIARKAQ
jgi:hypothetical protein